jgi:hypothetical protein
VTISIVAVPQSHGVGSSDHIVISTWREQGELSSRLCFWKKHQLRYLLGESLLQDVS